MGEGKKKGLEGGAKDRSGPVTDQERLWLTRECILRFLRATKFHEKESEKRLLETLAWRRVFGLEDVLTADHISPENETGKQLIAGYDEEGRPCHYLNPARQNTEPSHRQIEHLVFMLERVIDAMPPGQETLCLLINFKQSKDRKNTAPGIGLAREVLNILQMHYPERLGRCLIINVPWIVWGFFKIITPLIDPRTVVKLKFNEDMTQFVPADHLWSEYQTQGRFDFEYHHPVYWPALMALCEERRADRKRRWEAAGKVIGESEDYLSGRTEESVGRNQGSKKSPDDDATAAPAPAAPNGEATPAAEVASAPKPEDLKVDEMKLEDKGEAEKKPEETKATGS